MNRKCPFCRWDLFFASGTDVEELDVKCVVGRVFDGVGVERSLVGTAAAFTVENSGEALEVAADYDRLVAEIKRADAVGTVIDRTS